MLKIGEFARISQVSIKTLRHYDAIGVLRPSRIDPENGYRRYDIGQLADIMRVLALKDCGFALEEIAQLLRTYDLERLGDLLGQRVAAQQQVVADEQARLQRLQARVAQIASLERGRLYDVVLKRTEPLTLVGLRRYIATSEEIGPFAWEIVHRFERAALAPTGPLVHLYYDGSCPEEGFDLFVGAAVSALPPNLGELRCERLGAGEQVACVLYQGDYPSIGDAYVALGCWMASSGYHRSGPGREIYHRSPLHTTDPASYITEIQFPIIPAESPG
jgi:DNA-binding transcriptional MerR regulator